MPTDNFHPNTLQVELWENFELEIWELGNEFEWWNSTRLSDFIKAKKKKSINSIDLNYEKTNIIIQN